MANISVSHARDHAIVLFAGELDWDAAHELVAAINTLVQHYFYATVELVIASPGGDARALESYLGALGKWREKGVRVRTRVQSIAASAAAVMLSTGDERLAEPGACLLYHPVRVARANQVTAAATAEIHSALREIDQRIIAHLVERALATPIDLNAPYAAERSDRAVLERLQAGVGGRNAPARRRRRLAPAIGRAVEKAVRDGDRHALERLYARLLELDAPISAGLAMTLRLIDRVGPCDAEAQRPQGPPGLTVPEWRALYPPTGDVPRQTLTRHTLVLGETGSGKTASCVLPVVAAIARAPAERVGAALVIDPKRELAPALQSLAPQRLHHVRAETLILDVMAGTRWSLEADITGKHWISAARKILFRIASFAPGSPARVLHDHEPGTDNAEFFNREGTSLTEAVLAFILMMTDPCAPDPGRWLGHDPEALEWLQGLVQRANGRPGERPPNIVSLAAWALDGTLMSCPPSGRTVSLPTVADPEPRLEWLFARIANAAREYLRPEPGEGRDLCERILGYWTPMVSVDRQYAGVRAVASVICSEWASPAIARTLYFGCETPPGLPEHGRVDFARLVAPGGPGDLVLFQPARDGRDSLVAIALKALFFEAVLDDPQRSMNAGDLPLVGYIADEFHRFVTSDPTHGEQGFLDTCRSASAFCVLACQSASSIEHALAHGGGTPAQNHAAVSVLLNNTASKLIFRTTDPQTAERLAELSPCLPGLTGVVRVRPPSTLAPGECYAILADGRFERRQLERFGPPAPPSRATASCRWSTDSTGRS